MTDSKEKRTFSKSSSSPKTKQITFIPNEKRHTSTKKNNDNSVKKIIRPIIRK